MEILRGGEYVSADDRPQLKIVAEFALTSDGNKLSQITSVPSTTPVGLETTTMAT